MTCLVTLGSIADVDDSRTGVASPMPVTGLNKTGNSVGSLLTVDAVVGSPCLEDTFKDVFNFGVVVSFKTGNSVIGSVVVSWIISKTGFINGGLILVVFWGRCRFGGRGLTRLFPTLVPTLLETLCALILFFSGLFTVEFGFTLTRGGT